MGRRPISPGGKTWLPPALVIWDFVGGGRKKDKRPGTDLNKTGTSSRGPKKGGS